MTTKELAILKVAIGLGKITALDLNPFLQNPDFHNSWGAFLQAEKICSPEDWKEWTSEAKKQETWPDHPSRVQRENQRFLQILSQRGLFPKEKLQNIILHFRKALVETPHLRFHQFLLEKGVMNPSQMAQHLGVRETALFECPRCNYQIYLGEYLPWRHYPCLFCKGSLTKTERPITSPSPLKKTEADCLEKSETRIVAPQKGSRIMPLGPLSEERFGRYKILAKLGQGGMGAVYKVYDEELRREVALKVISSGSDDPRYIERFYREVRLAASLRHSNIIPVYEFGEWEERHFYTMACIEGKSLRKYVEEKKRLSEEEALKILEKVAQAVEYAHSQKVIHRDIKPENIIMDSEGEPYLMDFGLAKKVEASATRLTKTGAIVGSPEFMAPEQAWGEKGVSYGADIYALGGVLYFMLSGRPAFQGEDTMQILMQVLERDPVPLKKLNPRVTREVEIIAHKCLEKRPEHRYPHVGMLHADLVNSLEGEAIWARPPTRLQKGFRWVKRHRTRSVAAVLVVISLVTFLFLSYQNRLALEGERRRTETAERKREEFIQNAKAKKDWERQREEKRIQQECKRIREIMKAILKETPDRTEIDSKIAEISNFQYSDILKEKDFHIMKEILPCLSSKNEWQRRIAIGVIGRLKGDKLSYHSKTPAHWLVKRLGELNPRNGADLEDARLIIRACALLKDPVAFEPVHTFRLQAGQHTEFWEDTKEFFQQIPLFLGKTPRTAVEWHNQGLKYGLHGKWKEAIYSFTKAIELNPEMLGAYENRGITKREMRAFSEALRDFQTVLKHNPNSIGCHYNLAGLYSDKYCENQEDIHFDKALWHYQKVIRLEPGHKEAFFDMGLILLKKSTLIRSEIGTLMRYYKEKRHLFQNQIEQERKKMNDLLRRAAKCYEEVIKIDSQYFLAYFQQAFCKRIMSDTKGCEKILEEIIRKCPNKKITSQAYMEKAMLYNVNKINSSQDKVKLSRGLYLLNKAIDLDPRNAEAYNRRGFFQRKLGRYDLALENCDLAIRVSKTPNATFHFNRGKTLERLGRFHETLQEYQRSIELLGSSLEKAAVHHQSGLIYIRLNQLDKALSEFTKAIKADPTDYNSHLNRGVCHYKLKQFKKALADFTSVIRIYPQLPDAYKFRGGAYEALGKHKKAVGDYRKYIAMNPNDPEVPKIKDYMKLHTDPSAAKAHAKANDCFQQAVSRFQNRDLKGGIELLSEAIALNPRFVEAYVNRGLAYIFQKKRDKALSDFNRAISLNPNFAPSYKNRGLLYMEEKKHSLAAEDLQVYLRLNPRDPAAQKLREYIRQHSPK